MPLVLALASVILFRQDLVAADQVDGIVGDLIAEFEKGSSRGYDFFSISKGDTAAEDVVKIGDAAIPRLIVAIKSDNGWIRVHAAECLHDLKAKEATEPLRAAIATETESGIKGVLVGCLGSMGGAAEVKELIKYSSSTDHDVVAGAVRALGDTGSPEAIPTLMAHLLDKTTAIPSGSEVLSYAASEALSKIGKPAFEPLKTKLNTARPDEQSPVASAIAKMQDSEVVGWLVQQLGTGKGRKLFGDYLVRREEPSIKAAFAGMLADPDPDAQELAVRSIEFTTDKSAVAPLCEALLQALSYKKKSEDDWRPVQFETVIEAVHALGTIHDRAAIPTLRNALSAMRHRRDITDRMPEAVMNTLIRLDDKSSGELYLAYALDPYKDNEFGGTTLPERGAEGCGMCGLRYLRLLRDRYIAGKLNPKIFAAAVGEVRDEDCVPILIESMRDKDKEVRSSALWSLGDIKGASASEALIAALGDRSMAADAAQQLVRQGRIEGLRFFYDHSFKSYEDTPSLLGQLDPLDSGVLRDACGKTAGQLRFLIASKLAQRKDVEGIRLLEKLATSGAESEAIDSINQLAKLKLTASRPALISALGQPSVWVRATAFFAIRELDRSPSKGRT